MNICAVLSQAGMHDKAIIFSRLALKEFQSRLTSELSHYDGQFISSQTGGGAVAIQEKVKMTAICFYNLAVEEEHFGNLIAARNAYQASINLLKDHPVPGTE